MAGFGFGNVGFMGSVIGVNVPIAAANELSAAQGLYGIFASSPYYTFPAAMTNSGNSFTDGNGVLQLYLSPNTGGTATLRFFGRKLVLYHTNNGIHNAFTVTLDGASQPAVDIAPNTSGASTTITAAAFGSHTLLLSQRLDGTYFALGQAQAFNA